MRNTRTLTIAACLFALAAWILPSNLAGQAAPPPAGPGGGRWTHHDRAEQRMQRMTQMLNLTKDQQEKIRPIFEDQFKQMQVLRQDTSLTPEQRRAKAQEMRKSVHAQISQILTPEQREKLKEMRKSGYGMHHGRGMGQGPGMGPGPGQGQGPGGPPNQ